MSVTKQETPSAKPPTTQKASRKSNRVYVGNLAWKVHWQDLKDHMRQYGGNVVRADIFEDGQGRSRGCGIVEYETPAEAEEAIKNLTDTILFDRRIFVREDREDADVLNHRNNGGTNGSRRNARGAYSSRNGNQNNQYEMRRQPRRKTSNENIPEGCQLFVRNLPYRTTYRELKELFDGDGNVIKADVYEQNGRSRGCGVVVFKTSESAHNAIAKFNNYELEGRKLAVRLDEMKSSKRSNSRQ